MPHPEEYSAVESLLRSFLGGEIPRREFLRKAMHGGLALSLSSLISCAYHLDSELIQISPSAQERFKRVLSVLFPGGKDSPSAEEIHAFEYFQFVFLDPGVSLTHKELLRNGTIWIEEESLERFNQSFVSLSATQAHSLVTDIVETDWGERWCSRVIDYLLEALLSDPIYGGNYQQQGWHWLQHSAGSPRPTVSNRYPKLLTET